jgi:hypothetical protein
MRGDVAVRGESAYKEGIFGDAGSVNVLSRGRGGGGEFSVYSHYVLSQRKIIGDIGASVNTVNNVNIQVAQIGKQIARSDALHCDGSRARQAASGLACSIATR